MILNARLLFRVSLLLLAVTMATVAAEQTGTATIPEQVVPVVVQPDARIDGLVSQIENLLARVTSAEDAIKVLQGDTSGNDSGDASGNDSGDSSSDDSTIDDDGTRTEVSNFTPSAGQTYRNRTILGGVRVVWKTIDDVTFINCDFVDLTTDSRSTLLLVQAQDDGSSACHNWTFKNCTFIGATRSDWGHSHGAYLQGVDNFVFEECVFKDNGFIGTARFNQNHHVYMLNVGTMTFSRTTFDHAAAEALKCLGFEKILVEDCTFARNLVDIAGDDRSPAGDIVIQRCTFTDTGGSDSSGNVLGWCIVFQYSDNSLDSVKVVDCIFKNPAVDINTWAIKMEGSLLASVTTEGNDLSQWTGVDDYINKIGDRWTMN